MKTRVMPWAKEKQCPQCLGWWPADGEFYVMARGVHPLGACKACRHENRKKTPRNVEQGNANAVRHGRLFPTLDTTASVAGCLT